MAHFLKKTVPHINDFQDFKLLAQKLSSMFGYTSKKASQTTFEGTKPLSLKVSQRSRNQN